MKNITGNEEEKKIEDRKQSAEPRSLSEALAIGMSHIVYLIKRNLGKQGEIAELQHILYMPTIYNRKSICNI